MPDLAGGLLALTAIMAGEQPTGWTRHMRAGQPNEYPEEAPDGNPNDHP
jgi:hypothetical protein